MAKRSCGPRLVTLVVAVIVTGAGCGGRPGAAQGPIASEQATFELVTVVRGLEHPWGMAFLPDGDVLVTERPGRLRMVRDGVLDPRPIAGVPPVYASGQGGLLDVALDLAFVSNRVIYLSYAAVRDGGNSTRVARATSATAGSRAWRRSSSPCRWCARASTSGRAWRSTRKAICSSRSASAGKAIAPRTPATTTAR